MTKNGFEAALDQLKTVAKVNKKLTVEARVNTAEYFANQLRPLLAKSNVNKKHMKDSLKVIVDKDVVRVIFEENAWYWYQVEHGHAIRNAYKGKRYGRVKGTHTIRTTVNKEKSNLEKMMVEDIINKI